MRDQSCPDDARTRPTEHVTPGGPPPLALRRAAHLLRVVVGQQNKPSADTNAGDCSVTRSRVSASHHGGTVLIRSGRLSLWPVQSGESRPVVVEHRRVHWETLALP